MHFGPFVGPFRKSITSFSFAGSQPKLPPSLVNPVIPLPEPVPSGGVLWTPFATMDSGASQHRRESPVLSAIGRVVSASGQ